MNNLLTIIICGMVFITSAASIGIESLNIPVTAEALAMDNAGVALKGHTCVNPAYQSDTERLSYGSRRWLDGFIGHTIRYSFGSKKPLRLMFETIKDDKVNHYGDVPKDDLLGTIPVSWYSLGISYSHELMGHQMGIEVKPFMNFLYTEKLYGVSLNAGMRKTVSEMFSVGFAVKNIGWIDGDLSDQKMPIVVQAGAGGSFIDNKLHVYADARWINDSLEETIGCHFTWQYLSLFGSLSIRSEVKLPGAGISLDVGKWSIQYGTQVQENNALGIPQYIQMEFEL